MTQTLFTERVIVIVTTADRAMANASAEARGWGPDNYQVPLSAAGTEPATHYALCCACTQADRAAIEAVQAEALATQTGGPGIVLWGRTDFDAAAAESGLQRILPEGGEA